MKLGLTLPQGCDREYLGIDPVTAWAQLCDAARWAEDVGFESLWVYDHMQVDPPLVEAPIFEPVVELAAIATVTSRARLGHLVLSAAYRNAGLTAKAITTLDVISGGRAELGIGAGWKQDEWLAYGYGFPDAPERLAILADHLEVISRMLKPGRATYEGEHAHVRGAINEPKGIQDRIPIIVGGNGPNVTMRLAARFADELNLVFKPLDEIPDLMATARERCEEIDRDPATLRVSVHIWWEALEAGVPRPLLERYRDAGVARVMALVRSSARDDEALPAFRDAALDAGAAFARQPVRGAST